MPDWTSKFDMVVSLCCTGCKARVGPLDRELSRVGLSPSLRIWNVPDPSERLLARHVRLDRFVVRAGYLNCTLGHYRAIRTAYELGAERMLVVEDDVRFLRDIDLLGSIVASTPDSEVVMFDLLKDAAREPTVEEIRDMLDRSLHDGWATPQPHPCSMACTGLTRKGMSFFLDCFDKAFHGESELPIIDGFLSPKWRPPDVRVRVSWPLACIQMPVGPASNTAVGFFGGDTGCQLGWYRELGLDTAGYGG